MAWTRKLRTTNDLRWFCGEIALAAANGEIDLRNALVSLKACEQINVSLHTEAKIAAITLASGSAAPKMGLLALQDKRGG